MRHLEIIATGYCFGGATSYLQGCEFAKDIAATARKEGMNRGIQQTTWPEFRENDVVTAITLGKDLTRAEYLAIHCIFHGSRMDTAVLAQPARYREFFDHAYNAGTSSNDWQALWQRVAKPPVRQLKQPASKVHIPRHLKLLGGRKIQAPLAGLLREGISNLGSDQFRDIPIN
ncbi:MAG: hypothetical protein OXR66_06645 [Candidatus Woesearchaeota archaeon]|nr:hypothetical protein [Candidatus Woesearchaeota archaeon]